MALVPQKVLVGKDRAVFACGKAEGWLISLWLRVSLVQVHETWVPMVRLQDPGVAFPPCPMEYVLGNPTNNDHADPAP